MNLRWEKITESMNYDKYQLLNGDNFVPIFIYQSKDKSSCDVHYENNNLLIVVDRLTLQEAKDFAEGIYRDRFKPIANDFTKKYQDTICDKGVCRAS